MCGIVAAVSHRNIVPILLQGLQRLEYRGYDSCGVAVHGARDQQGQAPGLQRARSTQRVSELAAQVADPAGGLEGWSGIAHTRWATHGVPSERNAHPHLCRDYVAVVHNGIIENYSELKSELQSAGHTFHSETDTESVAHLLSDLRKEHNGDLTVAMREAVKRLRGSFTLLAVHADKPDLIVGVRRNSPLVVGVGNGENFLASDVAAFISHTKRALELGQDEVADITPNSIVITDLDGNVLPQKEYQISWDAAAAERGGFEHFMLKEIFEQPKAVADTLIGRLEGLPKDLIGKINFKKIEKVVIVACGTAFHSGLVGKYAIEKWGGLSVDVELASEFRYREPTVDSKTLVIPISQSGETMDTLMALRYAKERGAKIFSVCNTNGSTIPRESDVVLYTHAGPEIAVASTKAFATQLIAMYLIALHIGRARGEISKGEAGEIESELAELPAKIEQILETVEPLRELTRNFKNAHSMLFLGRHVGFPIALEGALKLKELAYMHAEGFAGGELKHGPIALIEEGTPVVAIMPSEGSLLAEKMASNIQEVKARGARVIVIAAEGAEVIGAEHVIRIPSASPLFQPVLATVPLQVFAYEIAVARGTDVDQPRNLAKSVTVE